MMMPTARSKERKNSSLGKQAVFCIFVRLIGL